MHTLWEHPGAKVEVQEKHLNDFIKKVRLSKAIELMAHQESRQLEIKKDEEALEKLA